MAQRTLTAANSVFTLSVTGLFLTPQLLRGYATDDAFMTDAQVPAETVMGVDGILSAGYVPVPAVMNVSLQADSPSNPVFDDWLRAMKAAREIVFANGTIALPSIGKKFTLTRGVLTSIPVMPGVKNILQARTFGITWEDVSPAPF